MSRKRKIILAVLAVAALTLGPIRWLSPDEQSAWAATLQTIGLVGTLLFAAQTLYSDQRDRRVDRVLALHEELTGAGMTGEARVRLARLLREKGNPNTGEHMQASKEDLRDDPTLNKYPDPETPTTPKADLALILRLFERIHHAHLAGTLDEHLLVVLIGPHAGWWDLAIARGDAPDRVALEAVAKSANEYVAIFEKRHPGRSDFQNWGRTRKKDFPNGPI